jgi:hypothetical protein
MSSNSIRVSRSPRPLSARPLPLVLCALMVGMSAGAHAEAYLPTVGGGGGGQFKAPCAQGQLLAGFELRVGDDVDAIRPICAIAASASEVNLQPVTSEWYGGAGGGIESLMCPSSTPVVTGMYVAAEGENTVIVNTIHLYCGLASETQAAASDYPSAVFDGPTIRGVKFSFPGTVGKESHFRGARYDCPAGQVAVGVHGRSGAWLDEVGLICGAPVVPSAVALGRVNKPVALGRVKTSRKPALTDAASTAVSVQTGPASGRIEAVRAVPSVSSTQAEPPICANARQARARKSPAAAGLEAQCRAAGGTP